MKQAARYRLAVSIEEAAQMLAVSRGLVYHLIDDGELRTVKIGRRRVVPVIALKRLLAKWSKLK